MIPKIQSLRLDRTAFNVGDERGFGSGPMNVSCASARALGVEALLDADRGGGSTLGSHGGRVEVLRSGRGSGGGRDGRGGLASRGQWGGIGGYSRPGHGCGAWWAAANRGGPRRGSCSRWEDGRDEEESISSDGDHMAVVDVSRKEWKVAMIQPPTSTESVTEVLYMYQNTFHIVPRVVERFERLKTFKFFANEIEILPPEAGDLVHLENLQVKISSPSLSGLRLSKLKSLRELELCRVPRFGVNRSRFGGSPIIDRHLSPDGSMVAYARDDVIHVLNVCGGETKQLTFGEKETRKTHGLAEYIAHEEMDRKSGFWWSPDSKYIAFSDCFTPLDKVVNKFSGVDKNQVPFAGSQQNRYGFQIKIALGDLVVIVIEIKLGPVWLDFELGILWMELERSVTSLLLNLHCVWRRWECLKSTWRGCRRGGCRGSLTSPGIVIGCFMFWFVWRSVWFGLVCADQGDLIIDSSNGFPHSAQIH